MSQYANLNQKLKNIFQIDRPDLDFGIYRILNARRKEIADYLDNRLKQKVESYLTQARSDVQDSQLESIAHELKEEFGKRAFDDAGKLVDEGAIESSLGQSYIALLEQSGNAFDETQVYSHLYTFFSRYYDEGDFISQRRYKGDTYAIPYAGEEVMLHWANKDQYYTKSGEMFSNYRIRFNSIGESDKTVLFRLLSADTAKDNQKDNDKNRRFIILSKPKTITRIDEEGEEYEETVHPLELSSDGKEMTIWFEYAVMDSKAKQDKLNVEAHDAILDNSTVSSQWAELMTHPAPTEKNPNRDLLLKHLDTYTQKNTADYFIHKDLGKFLSNELDFYIKNEVMHLDDVVNSSSFVEIEKKLAMIKCLRKIGQELIDFLASLENFQKKLWLKKKFVVSSHYCITLDRVDEDLYDEIASNPEQWQQWESLGFKIADDSLPHWGSSYYLKEHPYLMVDTSLFELDFKAKLLNSIDDLDEQTDGLIINSDNFQALNLLESKNTQALDFIYIDPPYNTVHSKILYKNNFEHSSWLTLLNQTISTSVPLLKDDTSSFGVAIDDYEFKNALELVKLNFPSLELSTIVINHHPQGSGGRISRTHEYYIVASSPTAPALLGKPKDDIEEDRSFMRSGTGENNFRFGRWKSFYAILVDDEGNVIRTEEPPEIDADYPTNKTEDNLSRVYPINSKGEERVWRSSYITGAKRVADGEIFITKQGSVKQKIFHENKRETLFSNWVGTDFNAGVQGTNVLNDLGLGGKFDYPKSLKTLETSFWMQSFGKDDFRMIDYFAGSGTSAHAVINLNREDEGSRKYILVEQGEYFDTVVKPRIQKVVYSGDWKDSQPLLPKNKDVDNPFNPFNGISHCLKVVKLESYEDALNNLELNRSPAQNDLFADLTPAQKDDYLMHYMLDIESKDSLLNVADFANPFDYQLKITADSAGAYTVQNIDLIDTFNYLIGLKVRNIDYQLKRGYVQVVGYLRTGEFVTVLWRDCSTVDYEALDKILDKLSINPNDKEYKYIYINGDHNINSKLTKKDDGSIEIKVRSIEQVFLERMFAE